MKIGSEQPPQVPERPFEGFPAIRSYLRTAEGRSLDQRLRAASRVGDGVLRAAAKRITRRVGVERVQRQVEDALHGRSSKGKPGASLNPLLGSLDYVTEISDPYRRRLTDFNVSQVPGVGTVKGVGAYGARAVSLAASTRDASVIPPDVSPLGLAIVERSRARAGLPVGQTMSESDYVEQLPELLRDYSLLRFYRTASDPNPMAFALQEWLDDKNLALDYLDSRGVLTAPRLFAGIAADFRLEMVTGYPVVAKKTRSAAGEAVRKCGNAQDLRDFVASLSPNDAMQVQAFVAGVDCSAQFFITEHGPIVISDTDQIIQHGVSHAGNKVSSNALGTLDGGSARADHVTIKKAATAIFDAGLRGYCAIDLVKPFDGGPARIIEINARPGGVTAAGTVSLHLGHAEFINQQFILPSSQVLDELLERYGFRRGGVEGVMPLLVIPLADGQVKAELLCLSEDGGRSMQNKIAEFLAY